tara:strand:+ start:198 stop:383 length:186 start_codon:yes stop_codon:yes gene_type:complete
MKGAKRTIIGLLLIILGLYSFTFEFFRTQFIELIKILAGNVGIFVIFFGLIIFLFGITEMS